MCIACSLSSRLEKRLSTSVIDVSFLKASDVETATNGYDACQSGLRLFHSEPLLNRTFDFGRM